MAAQGDLSYEAIASEEAARSFGLIVLAKNIQTSSANTTRFLILSRTETPLATPSKATVVFTVKNEVGALVRVLASFAESGLDMSRIESGRLKLNRVWCEVDEFIDAAVQQTADITALGDMLATFAETLLALEEMETSAKSALAEIARRAQHGEGQP